MKNIKIETCLGPIVCSIERAKSEDAIIFLHGVFLDKSIWYNFTPDLTGMNHIFIDMPNHGENTAVGEPWDLDDCVGMLIEIIESLGYKKVFAIGQSWGAMVILRAAANYPEKFKSIGLMNMPHKKGDKKEQLLMNSLKYLTGFKKVFGNFAARSLYSSDFLKKNPEIISYVQQNIQNHSSREIQQVIDAVMLNADCPLPYLKKLSVPVLAAIGKQDRVKEPAGIKTLVLPGGHVSAQEAVEESKEFILQVVLLPI